jgi:hypothetical protein
MTSQLHRFRSWLGGLILLGIVLYPLSFGPACWVNNWCGVGADFMATFYRPFYWGVGKAKLEFVANRYAEFGAVNR